MDTRELLTDHFERVHELYAVVVDGLDPRTAHRRPGGAGNPIAWLLWHAARIQDDHVAGLSGLDQAWPEWRERFALPLDDWDTGYGHDSEEVAAVRVDDLDLLVGYQDAVHARTLDYLATVDADELGRVVDRRWDPPVTAGARLVSVLGDCLQHLGQASYVKGLPGDG
jgi:hypothetical protein